MSKLNNINVIVILYIQMYLCKSMLLYFLRSKLITPKAGNIKIYTSGLR